MKNFERLLKFLKNKKSTFSENDYWGNVQRLASNVQRSSFYSEKLNFKSSLQNLLLAIFIFGVPFQISQGCGPYELQFEGYSFINPNIVNTKATYAPYFLRFNDLYTSYDSIQHIQQDENLREWNERFCDLYTPTELGNVIYKATITDMKQLRNSVADDKAVLPIRLSKNEFADHLRYEKCEEVIDYLIYAKQCEKHVTVGEGWEPPKRDVIEMQKMMERGKRAFYKTKSHYVRLRYAYQILRLAHYAKLYQAVLDLHEELMPKVRANPSLIDYWIMGHRAGALQKLGNRVEAAYLYSLVFTNSPSKRQSAYQSFSIKNDKEWKALMVRCESDDERAMVYTIRANDSESRAMEEMEKIYELDPLNENLELLTVKEITKLEKDLLGREFNDKRERNEKYFKIPRKGTIGYLNRTKAFTQKMITEKKVKNLDFWRIADAYLTFLSGDYYQADLSFTKIKNSLTSSNPKLKEQIEVAQLALKIAQLDGDLDRKGENEVGNIIRSNPYYRQYPDFADYINDKLVSIFDEKGEKGKAFRVKHRFVDLKMNPDLEIIDDLLEICKKPNPSNLEKVLVKRDGLATIESDLLLLRGIEMFKEDKIEAALEIFRRMPRNAMDTVGKFNPFHENIIDCIHCPKTDTILYDRVGIIEELLRLEYDARAHLERGAFSFYQMGNAYYNMTYFGESWNVTDLFRSGTNWKYVNPQNRYLVQGSELGNTEYMDLTKARKYYETTLELAKNKELAARACFMLAKCDLNDFYLDKETDYHPYDNEIPVLPEKYNQYYLKFKAEYFDTQFYEEAVEECLFLEAYD